MASDQLHINCIYNEVWAGNKEKQNTDSLLIAETVLSLAVSSLSAFSWRFSKLTPQHDQKNPK